MELGKEDGERGIDDDHIHTLLAQRGGALYRVLQGSDRRPHAEPSAHAVAEAVERRAVEFQNGRPSDDIAVLVARYLGHA